MKTLFRSLYTRVMLGSLVVLVTMAALFTFFFLRSEVRLLEKSLVERGQFLTYHTALDMRIAMLTRNRQDMLHYAETPLSAPDVVEVSFLDQDGNFITGKGRSGEISAQANTQPTLKVDQYAVQTVSGKEVYAFYHNVTFGSPQEAEHLYDEEGNSSTPNVIGWVKIEISGESIKQQKVELVRNAIALSLFATLAFAVILYRFLVGQVKQPLDDVRAVVDAAKEISKGNLEQKINVRFSNEIGMLAETFNNMARSIKEREDELLKLAAAVECAEEALVIASMEGIVVYANPAFEKITGYSREEIKGSPLSACFAADRESGECRMLEESHRRGESCSVKVENRRKDGTIFLTDQQISPILNPEGRQLYTLLVIRDITERDQLEKGLMQAQKMEAIGTLAGGVAHDFNNILGGILGYASLLRMDLEGKGVDTGDTLDIIEKLCRRAAKTTHHLLGYARRGKYRNEKVDINSMLAELADFLRDTVDRRIAIEAALTDALMVQADGNQLYQVFLNICLNSRDAMPEGGRLVLETDTVSVNGKGLRDCHGEIRPGRYARVVVTDTGTGMDRETRTRLFEPFFTTKETGKGTGLGLAMVYGIVTNHGGFMRVDTEPGRGTAFSVYLPIERFDEEQISR